MTIFISYSSKNATILNSFVERILRLGLGINLEDIKCTGIENSRPTSGENFKIWIKNNILEADIIIQLISVEYKESEVCLNEMGASWVSNKKVIPLLIEDIDYYNIGFLHNENQLLRLDSKENLHQLIDELSVLLGKSSIKTEVVNKQISSFLAETNSKKLGNKTKVKTANRRELNGKLKFFERFLEPDIDINALIEKSQPSLYDCKRIFRNEFAIEFYKNSNDFFLRNDKISSLEEYDYVDYTCVTLENLEKGESFAGGMTTLAKNYVFRKGVEFYAIHFKRNNEEYGFTLPVWCYINERWIILPKPWRMIKSIR
jgi:hypothetical protein